MTVRKMGNTPGREVSHTYGGTDEFSVLGADLELDAAAGWNDNTDPRYIMPIMGNLIGALLTKTANYLAGVWGKYSVTGAQSTTFPTGGVVGEAAGRCDGAVVAVLGSHDDQTEARPTAMFKVVIDNFDHNGGQGTAGAQFGLDLYDSRNGIPAIKYSKADLRLTHKVVTIVGRGAPQDGVTGANEADKGSTYIDIDSGNDYRNKGTLASPTWKLVTTA